MFNHVKSADVPSRIFLRVVFHYRPLNRCCMIEIFMVCVQKKSHGQIIFTQDGLFLVTNQPELIIGYPLAILTPNVMEHKRLVAKIVGERDQNVPQNPEVSNEDLPGQLQDLAKRSVVDPEVVLNEDLKNPKEALNEDLENPKEVLNEDVPGQLIELAKKFSLADPQRLSNEDISGELIGLAKKFSLIKSQETKNEDVPGQLQELAKK